MPATNAEILLKINADLAGIKEATSGINGFANQLKAGFNFDIGGTIASKLLELPSILKELGREAIDFGSNI